MVDRLTPAQQVLLTTCADHARAPIHYAGRSALCGAAELVHITSDEIQALVRGGCLRPSCGDGVYQLTERGRLFAATLDSPPGVDVFGCPSCRASARTAWRVCRGCGRLLDVAALQDALLIATETPDLGATGDS